MAQDVAAVTYTTDSVQPINPGYAKRFPVKLVASTTYPKGAVLGRQTAGGKYGLYASAGVGGLATAEAVLARACVTDASSNITYQTSTAGEWAQTDQQTDAFFNGMFFSGDISGADANYLSGRFTSIKGGAVIALGD